MDELEFAHPVLWLKTLKLWRSRTALRDVWVSRSPRSPVHDWPCAMTDGRFCHQRSSRGPSMAPAKVVRAMVPPYQSAMNGNESSLQ